MRSFEEMLYQNQRLRIAGWVGSGSKAFQRYQREYFRATSQPTRLVSEGVFYRAVDSAQCIVVGDYHSLSAAQACFLRLAKALLARGRRLVFALEFFEARYQSVLDQFCAGKVTLSQLAHRTKHLEDDGRGHWNAFAPMLDFAQKNSIQLLGIDRRGQASLFERDAAAAQAIANVLRNDSETGVLALIGQFHLSPSHLPAALAARGVSKAVVVYQNVEHPHFAEVSRAPGVVCFDASTFGLQLESPLECQHSFLRFIDRCNAQLQTQEPPAAVTLQSMLRRLARFAQTPLNQRHIADALHAHPARVDDGKLSTLAFWAGRILAEATGAAPQHYPERQPQKHFRLEVCGTWAEMLVKRSAHSSGTRSPSPQQLVVNEPSRVSRPVQSAARWISHLTASNRVSKARQPADQRFARVFDAPLFNRWRRANFL